MQFGRGGTSVLHGQRNHSTVYTDDCDTALKTVLASGSRCSKLTGSAPVRLPVPAVPSLSARRSDPQRHYSSPGRTVDTAPATTHAQGLHPGEEVSETI